MKIFKEAIELNQPELLERYFSIARFYLIMQFPGGVLFPVKNQSQKDLEF
jgi:hypothetical protein